MKEDEVNNVGEKDTEVGVLHFNFKDNRYFRIPPLIHSAKKNSNTHNFYLIINIYCGL